ncbi:hypothetical protein RASY3_00110 [Ruminococcus albus SY3]|uniref:Uncharacterized protein n=1 Tax=Ruminococcus albus SY3 TaxID=1341156 RepID=A0A011UJQ3_RUMAL|nr:hypothetical protein [Ruminococcus albus]EXM40884.1 hypothetical protein RASY3_00110 [Ruminococcus albus SY3]
MKEDKRVNIGESASASSSSLKVDELAEKKKNQKKSLIKLGTMGVITLILFIFSSIAWFTMNKDVGTSGMGVQVAAIPYTIQTRNSSGYYKDKWDSINSDAMEWKISSTKNFDNHEDAINTAVGETDPGIEPGDHGILEFRVNPNNADTITVDCIFDIKAYVETTTTGENNQPVTEMTEITNSTLVGYLKAHIMLFLGIDANDKYTGLIGTDAQLRRVLANQTYTRNGETYTQIYWVWPLHLSDLTSDDADDIIYASSERSAVIAYIASNRNGFFKDCSDSEAQVTSDLTALAATPSSTTYNHYNTKYDNADLEIGNNVSYVMLSMQVE